MQPDMGRLEALLTRQTVDRRGRLVRAGGTTLIVTGIDAEIGATCVVEDVCSGHSILAEVVGFTSEGAILTPLGPLAGLSVAAEVRIEPGATHIAGGEALLGRVVDAIGNPIDGRGPVPATGRRLSVFASPPDPLARPPIDRPLETGIAAIDTMLTLGVGQRVGVFAPAGAGKSTLIGMLTRFARVDATVIALIGERGREVREFLEDNLGADGLARAVIVAATADRPAMERVRAAHAATAIAEGLRAEGKSVLLLMDSVTRFARALREIGLAAGEPPVRRGFPPSVFAELPRLFERAGRDAVGAITAVYTVLMEEEDASDPIAEEVRSLLDGHILLSRKLADAGRFPAIDPLASLSRLFPRLASPGQARAASEVRRLLAAADDIALLLQMGEYRPGADPVADRAQALKSEIEALLRQSSDRPVPAATSRARLLALAEPEPA